MKDERLEKQFDEYFGGVKLPEGVTDDAKKYAVKKTSRLPKFVKFASIAASFIIVFAAAVAVIARTDFNMGSNGTNSGDVSPAPDDGSGIPPSDGDNSGNVSPAPDTYGDGNLSLVYADPYTIGQTNASLKLIQKLAFSDSAAVVSCTAGYLDGELAIVKAEISAVDGLNRHDGTVYVEFCDSVYEEVYAFSDGQSGEYKGITYYLTKTVAQNGEPQTKLLAVQGGVKYYFDVVSSDENAYIKYLQLLIK